MKLIEKNDWGNLTYWLGSERLTTQIKTINIKLQGIWDSFIIDWRVRNEHINDMGHEYGVNSFEPWITINYKGVKIDVSLMQFQKRPMKI